MAADPFFSIVLAVYNVEHFIEATLNSVISQTFQDWELIIVDDASSDNTVEIISRHEDPRIKLIRNEINSGGCFVPREIAALKAKGKYIVHIDGDDLILENHLKNLYDHINRDGADLVLPEMWRFEQEPSLGYKILPASKIDVSKIWQGKDLVKFTIFNWEIPVAGYALRKDIFIDSIRFVREATTEFQIADEIQSRFMLKMARKVSFTDDPYFYRINANSVTGNKYSEVKRLSLMADMLKDFSETYYGKDSEEYDLAKLNQFYYILHLYKLSGQKQFTREQRINILKIIEASRKKLRVSEYKGKVSLHYYVIMWLPVVIGKPMLRFVEILKTLKSRR